MRLTHVLALAATLAVAGCCGSMQVDRSKLDLPATAKAMDQVHARIAAQGAGRLHAGAAMVDITPEGEILLGGFDMGRKSTGVRDPIHVHALYLDDGVRPFVLVSLNTIGYLRDDVLAVRALASDLHRDSIWIASIHNHVTPDTMGYWGPAVGGFLPICPGTCPNYMETLRHKIAQAIDQAALAARPARLRAASGPVDPTLSLNIHPEIRRQKDDVVRVLTFEDEAGAPIALVANWGCHVEALWNDTQVSADWAGVFYERMMREWGGVPLFVEGALGGLVTIDPGDEKMALEDEIMDVYLKHMSMDERIAIMKRVGNGLADAVFAALKDAPAAQGPAGITLQQARVEFELHQDNWIFNYMGNRGLLKRDAYWRKGETYVRTEVGGLRVRADGRTVADLVSVPGEPAPTVVEDLDATSDAPVKITVALGNDENGYLVREADWDLPQYAYERTMSLGKKTATVVIDAVTQVRGMLSQEAPAATPAAAPVETPVP